MVWVVILHLRIETSPKPASTRHVDFYTIRTGRLVKFGRRPIVCTAPLILGAKPILW